MDEAAQIETLIRELDAQKDAYVTAFQKIHDRLTQNLAASAGRTVAIRSSSRPTNSRSITALETETRPSTTVGATSVQASSLSKSTGNESDDEDDSLYSHDPLPRETFDEEGLRAHLKSFKFNPHTKKILDGVADDLERLSQIPLLPTHPGPCEDRSHYTHSQIFDVGTDGAPLPVDHPSIEHSQKGAMALWHAIKEINPPNKERQAVGRIAIVREPSPILFGALHYTMRDAFDIDELFRSLVAADLSSASMFRAFDDDERRRRSFVFNFEYFTLIGDKCVPMKWQLCAGQEDQKPGFIQISRCSSVVALSLTAPSIKEIKNPSRRRRSPRDLGSVYDPFSPWKVLNLQCYPDWKATLDVHDSTKHYVNGPEAFLNTILGEFRDAARRFEDITKKISKSVRPSYEFMFDSALREPLLFEDDDYSVVKSYFWAHQTLGIMNESMQAMIDAFEDTFTDDVWEGKHPTLWPLLDENRARNRHFRQKMAKLKADILVEIKNLRTLIDENEDRQTEIDALREALFAGTSIKESRTTTHQGHNIKLLTLVNLAFLPLTFVSSIFGMTNMPTAHHYWMFGIVTCTICVPFFILVGWLNSDQGFRFSRNLPRHLNKTLASCGRTLNIFSWKRRRGLTSDDELTPTRSRDSVASGTTTRRWSFSQGRLGVSEEPNTREEAQMRKEDFGLKVRTRTLSESRWEKLSREQTSTLATMMWEEKDSRKRLKYHEGV